MQFTNFSALDAKEIFLQTKNIRFFVRLCEFSGAWLNSSCNLISIFLSASRRLFFLNGFLALQCLLQELDSKTSKDASTETETYFPSRLSLQLSSALHSMRKDIARRQLDSSTPGRAVMLLKTGTL